MDYAVLSFQSENGIDESGFLFCSKVLYVLSTLHCVFYPPSLNEFWNRTFSMILPFISNAISFISLVQYLRISVIRPLAINYPKTAILYEIQVSI